MICNDYKKRRIRLENERWSHINDNHPETRNNLEFLKNTLESPDFIQEGNKKELLAVKIFEKTPVSKHKYCTVVYKVNGIDGFVITSYFTRRPSFKRKLIWKR